MTGAKTFTPVATAAERAAALSARIHRWINAGKPPSAWLLGAENLDGEIMRFQLAMDGRTGLVDAITHGCPFARLGAELRAIALGNRGER